MPLLNIANCIWKWKQTNSPQHIKSLQNAKYILPKFYAPYLGEFKF